MGYHEKILNTPKLIKIIKALYDEFQRFVIEDNEIIAHFM